MSQSLSQLYIHIIFHTKHNQNLIKSDIESELFAYFGGILKQNKCVPIIINGIENHVHILCIMSKNIALAKLLEELKRNSSRWIKTKGVDYTKSAWQGGYGGFPTQTAKETVESLEIVRGLFEEGSIQSAFWHRYAMTVHSPSGQSPASVGAKSLQKKPNSFANNEIPFSTPHEIDLDHYGKGLNLATYNYMNGAGYDVDVAQWFKKINY